MFRQARHLVLSATLSSAMLLGCNSNKQPAPGSVTVSLPNGTTEVIPAGQPIPVGATVVASGGQSAPTVAPGPSMAPAPGSAITGAAPAPAAPSPVASAPSAQAPAPALVVPAGTHVFIRTNETLSAEHGGGIGSGFSGELSSPVTVRGVVAFPRGTSVRGEIVSANGRGHFTGAGVLGVELRSIGNYRVESSEYIARVKGRGKRTAGFIGGGAGVGALIGGLAGGGKGALIGGLSGAGAGTAAGAYTGSRDVVIPAESAIGFTLRSAITLK